MSRSSFNPGSLERRGTLGCRWLPVCFGHCQARATSEKGASPLQHHTGEHQHLWLPLHLSLGSLPSAELAPVATGCHKGPQHGQRGWICYPGAPVAKSAAELTSLQLITCTSVSRVPLEQGMPLTKFQLQPPALLQAHPQVRD